MAIVGGGTAGLACANRLLQLLGDDPELMEKLGEVPVAVIEKAKTCGGHNLSGAVMRPEPLQELFPEMSREDWRKERFAFGEVTKEVGLHAAERPSQAAGPDPPPPNFKNHGNEVVSVAALARYQQRAGRGGRRLRPDRDLGDAADRRGRPRRRRPLRRQGPRQGRRAAAATSSPAPTSRRASTVLAEGCWGHLTGAAIKEFGLADGREPQVWELGVKEVWKVPKPLDRVIHTIGAVAAEAVAPSTARSAAPGCTR